MKIFKEIGQHLVFCFLFIPYLLIDLLHIAIETTEWERQGANKNE